MSIRFEVGGDILKVARGPLTGEGFGGRPGPQQGTGAEPCWGSGGKAPGSKMRKTF